MARLKTMKDEYLNLDEEYKSIMVVKDQYRSNIKNLFSLQFYSKEQEQMKTKKPAFQIRSPYLTKKSETPNIKTTMPDLQICRTTLTKIRSLVQQQQQRITDHSRFRKLEF